MYFGEYPVNLYSITKSIFFVLRNKLKTNANAYAKDAYNTNLTYYTVVPEKGILGFVICRSNSRKYPFKRIYGTEHKERDTTRLRTYDPYQHTQSYTF